MLFLFKDEITEIDGDNINKFRIDFMLNEIEGAKDLLDNVSYLIPHKKEEFWEKDRYGKIMCCHYIGKTDQEIYINVSQKHVQIQAIEKSLLEELIDVLHPNLFTNEVLFRDNMTLYPIWEVFDRLC
jgi:hypothetical protein